MSLFDLKWFSMFFISALRIRFKSVNNIVNTSLQILSWVVMYFFDSEAQIPLVSSCLDQHMSCKRTFNTMLSMTRQLYFILVSRQYPVWCIYLKIKWKYKNKLVWAMWMFNIISPKDMWWGLGFEPSKWKMISAPLRHITIC